MNKRFECPDCGAGIKPNDKQCPRCGSDLKHPEIEADPHLEEELTVPPSMPELQAGITSYRLKPR